MKKSIRFFRVTCALCLVTGLLTPTSFAVEPKALYAQGTAAYDKGDFVDALKYLFAYKTIIGEAMNNDPGAKRRLDAVIAFCEERLRGAHAFAAAGVLSSGKVGVKGTLMENPYQNLDRSTIEKVLKGRSEVVR